MDSDNRTLLLLTRKAAVASWPHFFSTGSSASVFVGLTAKCLLGRLSAPSCSAWLISLYEVTSRFSQTEGWVRVSFFLKAVLMPYPAAGPHLGKILGILVGSPHQKVGSGQAEIWSLGSSYRRASLRTLNKTSSVGRMLAWHA